MFHLLQSNGTDIRMGKIKYLEIKSCVKTWILEGRIAPNERLPSENALAELFRVSRHTVRQAVRELAHEGWLISEQGKGTFVRPLHTPGIRSADGKALRLGVICTYLQDYIFPHIVSGIESFVAARGHTLSLFSTGNDTGIERRCLETALSQGLHGLIVEPTRSTLPNPNIDLYFVLQQRNVPYVMLHSSYIELNSSMVALNDAKGAYLATDHLISLGHQRIGAIFKADDMQGRNRFRGFVKAHQDRHLSVNARSIHTYTTDERSIIAIRYVEQVIAGQPEDERPTAVVCYNDEIAIQLLQALRGAGISVPEEVSVTGFDDSTLAQMAEVPLTTVTHPKEVLGMEAAKMLLSMFDNMENMWIPRECILEPELVVRTSSAPPNG